MPEAKLPTPSAQLELAGRTVKRTRVVNDWGNRVQFRVSRDGAVIATPDARLLASYTHPEDKPGAYEIVLETWDHEGYRNGGLGKYVEISNKVAYTV